MYQVRHEMHATVKWSVVVWGGEASLAGMSCDSQCSQCPDRAAPQPWRREVGGDSRRRSGCPAQPTTIFVVRCDPRPNFCVVHNPKHSELFCAAHNIFNCSIQPMIIIIHSIKPMTNFCVVCSPSTLKYSGTPKKKKKKEWGFRLEPTNKKKKWTNIYHTVGTCAKRFTTQMRRVLFSAIFCLFTEQRQKIAVWLESELVAVQLYFWGLPTFSWLWAD